MTYFSLSRRAVIATALVLAGAVAHADDTALLATYDQVNSADIETAELGAINGHSAKVRALAVMVLRDHAGVRQMARDIAAAAGVTYDLPANADMLADHKAAIARLSALQGTAFDAAYLQHESTFHTAAIDAVKQVLIPTAETSEFRDHLEAVLPAFEHHLAVTLETARALGYEIE